MSGFFSSSAEGFRFSHKQVPLPHLEKKAITGKFFSWQAANHNFSMCADSSHFVQLLHSLILLTLAFQRLPLHNLEVKHEEFLQSKFILRDFSQVIDSNTAQRNHLHKGARNELTDTKYSLSPDLTVSGTFTPQKRATSLKISVVHHTTAAYFKKERLDFGLILLITSEKIRNVPSSSGGHLCNQPSALDDSPHYGANQV